VTNNLHIIGLLACCLALVSCRGTLRATDDSSEGGYREEKSCRAVFRIGGIGISLTANTKVESPDSLDECNIKHVHYLVFDENCRLEDYVRDPSPVVSILTSPGYKKVYAVVNYPDSLGFVDTEDELLAQMSDLADNAPDALVMVGHKGVELPASDTTIISVRRLVTRVTLAKVTTDFTLPSTYDEDFKLLAIYLSNVCGAINLSGDEVPCDHWYCRGGYYRDIPPQAVSKLIWSPVEWNLTKEGSYERFFAFYTYPNVTEDDSDDLPWSKRHTKIVLEVAYKGKTYYYPVSLPVLHGGKSYDIQEICLTRPGSADEDFRVESLDATFKISISDWDTVEDWGHHDGHREDNTEGTVVI